MANEAGTVELCADYVRLNAMHEEAPRVYGAIKIDEHKRRCGRLETRTYPI